jgi:hypothetical protein
MIRARFVLPPLLTLLVAAACSKSASNPTATITFGTDAGDASVALDAAGAPDASDGATAAALDDAGACTSPDFTGAPLGVHCNALVDTSGRTVLLHGVNARVAGVFDVTFTDGRLPPASARSASTRSASRSAGAASSRRRMAASPPRTWTTSPP